LHARRVLGWAPQLGFDHLIAEMVDADLQRLTGAAVPPRGPAAPT